MPLLLKFFFLALQQGRKKNRSHIFDILGLGAKLADTQPVLSELMLVAFQAASATARGESRHPYLPFNDLWNTLVNVL